MAILWQKNLNGTSYQVRTAGQSRRLYTDGVFHSQFHPARATAGGIWDLLMLPALFYSPQKIQRVLVLGVGGGAVIRQLHRYIEPAEIVGVELNPVHLEVAQRFFGVDKSMAQLHQADAIQWVRDYDGPKFDMIIEDLFGEEHGEPVRAIKADKDWCRCLSKLLTRDGMLVLNFIDRPEMRHSECLSRQNLSRNFKSAFLLTLPKYENVIVALLKTASDSRTLRSNLEKRAAFKKLRQSECPGFRIRRLNR
jgi:spermidine synthase